MRRLTHSVSILVCALILVPLSASAAVDSPTDADPTTHSRANDAEEHELELFARQRFDDGTDIAFQGNLLVAGSEYWNDDSQDNSGIYLYRLEKDGTPRPLGFANCRGYHSDVGIWRDFAFQSHDTASDNQGCAPGMNKEGVRIFDISNPRKPHSIGFAETIHGSHNFTVVGDTGLIYVSSYNLVNATDIDGVSIIDMKTDPNKPKVKFLEFPDPSDNSAEHEDMKNESGIVPTSMGCHDIGLDLKRDRAFCAGVTETQIWDISKPQDPVIISIIHNPLVSIHHGAQVNRNGKILVVQDEWLGAAGYSTGCLAPRQPSGAIWFYDISDVERPLLLSYWSFDEPRPTADYCTSHFFGTFPDRDWLVTSWDDHGVYVVDFTNPSLPTMVAHAEPEGGNFWSAYPYRGHIYAASSAPRVYGGGTEDGNKAGGLWVFDLTGWGKGK